MSHNRDLSAAAAQIGFNNSNIGIGEDNPQNSLHISGSSPTIRFKDTGSNGSAFSIIEDNDGLFKIRNDAGNSGTGSGIAFEVDAAERVRINSAGLVGIATAVPSYRLDIGDGVTDPAGGNQLRVNASGDYIFALQKQSNASFSIRNNSTGIVHLNTQNSKILSLGVNSGNVSGSIEDDVRIDSNGHLTVRDGNLVIGTSGHGIDFSATGDANGMSSELLDDYEEGIWTPTIRLDGGTANGTTVTPTSPYKGRYVKIGDMVFVEAYVRYDLSSLSGTWSTTVIEGLPYTQGNQNSQQYSSVHIGYLSGFYSGFPTTGNNFPAGYIRTGQTDLVLTINNPNSAETTVSNSVLSSSSNAGIMFSAFYRDSASG